MTKLICTLACTLLFLAGCPDAKPPKDPSLVPTPKAEITAVQPA